MGQQVYDPITKRGLTIDEANEVIKARQSGTEAVPPVTTDQTMGNTLGLQMPNAAPGDINQSAFQEIFAAVPQLAGLIASFTPVGRAGYTASGMVPAVTDVVLRAMRGEPFDAESAAVNFAGGMTGHGVGNVIKGTGQIGQGMFRRSLGLTGGDEVLEQDIPRRLLKEKAEMSIPGVAKLREKVDATKDPWLKEATDALAKARYKADNAPNLNTGGIMAMAGDAFLPPQRQMAVGSALARPTIGVPFTNHRLAMDTEKQIAPTAETGFRALMAWIASQLGAEQADEPTPQGPRRREPR